MSRYSQLFEIVTDIVRDYGVGVLTETRFWGFITDLYPFTAESSLRDIFRTCIVRGWISKLVTLSGDKVKILEYIRQIVFANPHLDRTNLVASLFSVSIALGICNKEDYEKFDHSLVSISKPSITYSRTTTYKPASYQQPKNTSAGKRQLGINQATNNGKTLSPQNTFLIFALTLCLLIAIIIIPVAISSHKKYKNLNEESSENIEYAKKVQENKELVMNRKNFDSVLSIKNIELGSDYRKSIQNVKSSQYFQKGKHLRFELDLSKGRHPVYLLMYGGIKERDNISRVSTYDVIAGDLYVVQTNLDSIQVVLKIFEWDGKIPFVMVEGRESIISYSRDSGDLLNLYMEKYGIPEKRTYDGLPYNPDKHYNTLFYYEAKHEDCVWTFSKGVIRLGMDRIVYLTNEFLEMAEQQYEIANEKHIKRERFVEDSLRKDRIRKHREDSLRRIESHEKAIRDI